MIICGDDVVAASVINIKPITQLHIERTIKCHITEQGQTGWIKILADMF